MQWELVGARMRAGFWIAARCFQAKRIRVKKPKFGKRPLAQEFVAANPLENFLFWQVDGKVVGWLGKLSVTIGYRRSTVHVYIHATAADIYFSSTDW